MQHNTIMGYYLKKKFTLFYKINERLYLFILCIKNRGEKIKLSNEITYTRGGGGEQIEIVLAIKITRNN